jgi:ubiquinone/menaquinone biosynthesis C-methylase UbiE
MGFYDRHVLPRLIDLAMRSRVLDRHRRQAVALARRFVLEIGVGSGPNLALYGPAVERVCAIDPSPELLRLAGRRSAEAAIPVSLTRASAERLPFLDAVFDTVVMTWTLCSVADPALALAETRRVLKPGGRHIAGGCHLDRRIDDLVCAAGFRLDAIETGYIKGPKPWTFLYHGSASA